MGCHDDSTHSLHNVVYALFWRPRSNRDMQVQSPSRPWHKAKLTSISSRSCKLRRAHCHDIMGIMRSPFIKPQDLFIVAPRHATNSNTTTLSTCFGYVAAQLAVITPTTLFINVRSRQCSPRRWFTMSLRPQPFFTATIMFLITPSCENFRLSTARSLMAIHRRIVGGGDGVWYACVRPSESKRRMMGYACVRPSESKRRMIATANAAVEKFTNARARASHM